jgi:hypothetical protein
MGLLDDIRDGGIRCSSDIDGVLRQCLLLAAKLGHAPFQAWVESELNGYSSEADLPDYRIVPASIYADVWYEGRTRKISLPPGFFGAELRQHATKIRLRQNVATLRAMAQTADEMGFHPANTLRHYIYQQLLEQDYYLESALQVVSQAAFLGVISAICTRLTMFVLEIEKSNLDLDSAPIGSKPIPEQTLERAFHLIVQGPGAIVNVSTGSGAIQNVVHQVVPGDLSSLASYLRSLGIEEDDLASLDEVAAEATAADLDDATSPLSQWIERVTQIGEGAAKTVAKESVIIALRIFLGQVVDFPGLPPIGV